MQKSLLIAQFLILAFLATLHAFALANYWYWTLPWLDLVAHFFGGAWAALLFYWMSLIAGRLATPLFVVALVLVLGVAWEVFEFAVGISAGPGYAADTLTDLLMDIIGASVAVYATKIFFTNPRG